jgi:hypothetical protein
MKIGFLVAAAGALGATLALAPAQAAVQNGADTLRTAFDNGALIEQVQFRFGGREYCWYDEGWMGPGWYWCGYAYRVGFGWGGALGWNNWRHEVHPYVREHREFREFHEHEFHDHDFRH